MKVRVIVTGNYYGVIDLEFNNDYSRRTKQRSFCTVIDAALLIVDEETKQIQDKCVSLVLPQEPEYRNINPHITELTGITKELLLREGEEFQKVHTCFENLCAKYHVRCIYSFGDEDKLILNNDCRAILGHTSSVARKMTDIQPYLENAVKFQLPGGTQLSLDALLFIYGFDFEQRHRALSGAESLARILSQNPEHYDHERAKAIKEYYSNKQHIYKIINSIRQLQKSGVSEQEIQQTVDHILHDENFTYPTMQETMQALTE